MYEQILEMMRAYEETTGKKLRLSVYSTGQGIINRFISPNQAAVFVNFDNPAQAIEQLDLILRDDTSDLLKPVF
jgi:hypothetical protein